MWELVDGDKYTNILTRKNLIAFRVQGESLALDISMGQGTAPQDHIFNCILIRAINKYGFDKFAATMLNVDPIIRNPSLVWSTDLSAEQFEPVLNELNKWYSMMASEGIKVTLDKFIQEYQGGKNGTKQTEGVNK